MAKMTLSLRPPPKTPGRLSQALTRLLMRRASVVAVKPLADRFRLITLRGPALAGVSWAPGQKIQIAMGSAFVARTYTPMEWDASEGLTRFLGYAHGDGPGSAWVRAIEPGDECDIFGPRGSLEVGSLTGPLAVFGDETSMGLAHAIAAVQDRARPFTCTFEVGEIESAGLVVARLGLPDAALFARTGDEAGHARTAGRNRGVFRADRQGGRHPKASPGPEASWSPPGTYRRQGLLGARKGRLGLTAMHHLRKLFRVDAEKVAEGPPFLEPVSGRAAMS